MSERMTEAKLSGWLEAVAKQEAHVIHRGNDIGTLLELGDMRADLQPVLVEEIRRLRALIRPFGRNAALLCLDDCGLCIWCGVNAGIEPTEDHRSTCPWWPLQVEAQAIEKDLQPKP